MTTKRAPKWQRAGFASEAEYRSACAATRRTRKAAFLNTKAKLAQRLVLEAMWNKADFHRPVVTITKEQIMADAGCCYDTVRTSVRFLRNEGSIKPMKNWQGGRKVPTTWLLTVPGKEKSPSDDQMEIMETNRDREATWRFLSGKYGPLRAVEIMGDPPE
jgi:hypothetical protein